MRIFAIIQVWRVISSSHSFSIIKNYLLNAILTSIFIFHHILYLFVPSWSQQQTIKEIQKSTNPRKYLSIW